MARSFPGLLHESRHYTHPMTTTQVPPTPRRPAAAAPRETAGRAGGPQPPPDEQPLRYCKGVGPSRAAALAHLGLRTVEDACYFAPRRYEDRTRLLAIKDLAPGVVATVRGRVAAAGLRRARRGQAIFEAAVDDGTGVLSCLWFHMPYLARQIRKDDDLILYGTIGEAARPQMIHPEFERLDADEDPALHLGRIVPVYPLTASVGQRWLRRLVAGVVEQAAGRLDDVLPARIRAARGWPSVDEAVRTLHFPPSWDALERARESLAFAELFLLQALLAQRRVRTQARVKPQRYQLDGPVTRRLRASLPFALTASQSQVLDELLADLAQAAPMSRLLQGDVGCGKTIVLVSLLAVAVQSGYQAALMAPTELLAEQHRRTIAHYLEPLGVSAALLAQGVPAAERRRLAARIADGTIQVVVGTHALIQRGVAFKRLALVLIDEQHKFGVVQRARLARKAQEPDVLVVTATPIPRTLALSLYGDLAISTISEMPPGRQPVTTRWLRETQREELYGLIRREAARGRQAYIVYPRVKDDEREAVRGATAMAKRLQAVFPEFAVGLLHGQMPGEEKDRIMQAFVRREFHLLVSTVIVEVGLDVSNATLMVVEHPERFGLAQLHQLRGRIGRGPDPAQCLVVSDAQEDAVRRRLEAFVGTTDGFAIAEQDLELRGPGELLGRQQSGWLRFRIASLARDRGVLDEARTEAFALLQANPALSGQDVAGLRRRLLGARRPSARARDGVPSGVEGRRHTA